MLRLLPSAVIGLGLEAQRRSLSAATYAAATIGGRAAPWVSGIVRPVIPPAVATATRRHLDNWSARGRAEQRRAEEEAAAAAAALIQALADAVIDQIDLDAVVSRVDLDQVAARVDVEAVLDRLDLATLTERVLEEIDIGRLVRESGGSMAAETMDAFRVQSVQADRFVNRIADRLLFRGPGRDAAAP